MDFSYHALAKDGSRQSGTLQAPSREAAGHLLKEQGLLPTEISASAGKSGWMSALSKISTISLNEKIAFVQNLEIMLKSGIAISRAMHIQLKQTKNPRFKSILTDLCAQVEAGKSLSEAMSKYEGVFSNIFLSMIRVGEMSGNLEKSLKYLAVQLQREADLKSKTRGAMIYPSVIVGAMVIIGILMGIFVLPKLTSIFKEFGSNLPLITRGVVALADFMSAHAFIVLGGVVVFTAGFVAFLKTPNGKYALDFTALHFLMISGIVKKINLARFSRILSSLLKSGIPIVEALQVASDSFGNVFYKEIVAKAASDVRLGKSLTQALEKDEKLFPVLVVQMLQVGEESGTTEEILSQLADHYEEEVDMILKNLSSIIEPLLLLFIGGIVGILAVALIMPIYNISQSIQ